MVVQRDNAINIIRHLRCKTKLSEKFHDLIPKEVIKKTNLSELFSMFATHCLNMIQLFVKLNEYIQYGL